MNKTAVIFSRKVASSILMAILTLSFGTLVAAQEGDAEAGASKITVCLACHGQDGNMSQLPNVPKIGGQNEKYLLRQLYNFQNRDRVAALMTGMLSGLSDQDLADIAAHYASQEMSEGAAEPDKVALASTIYRAGNVELGVPACTACHSPNGQGLASAGYPALRGQDVGYTENQLKAYRAGERNNEYAEIMQTIAARLSDAEIAALASFVSGLR